MTEISGFSNKINKQSRGVYEIHRYVSKFQLIVGFLFCLIPIIALYFYSGFGNILFPNHGASFEVISYHFDWDKLILHLKSPNSTLNLEIYFIAWLCSLYISIALAWRNFQYYYHKKFSILIDSKNALVTIDSNGSIFSIPFSDIDSFEKHEYRETDNGKSYTIYQILLFKKDGYYWEITNSRNKEYIEKLYIELTSEIDFNLSKPTTPQPLKRINNFENQGIIELIKISKFPSYWLFTNTLVYLYALLKFCTNVEKIDIEIVIPSIILLIPTIIGLIVWRSAIKNIFFKYEFSFDNTTFYLHKINRFTKQIKQLRQLKFENVDRILLTSVNTKHFLGNDGLVILAKEDLAKFDKHKAFNDNFKYSIGFALKTMGDIEMFSIEKYLQDKLKQKGFIVQ